MQDAVQDSDTDASTTAAGASRSALAVISHGGPPSVPRWLAGSAAWSWRALVIGAALYFTLLLIARLSVVVLPLIIAVILATLTVPLARRLRENGVPRALAAVIVVIGGVAVIVGLLAALAPSFADQIEQLRPTVEEGLDSAIATVERFGFDRARIDELIGQTREQLSGSASTIASGVAGGLAAAASLVTGLALMLVLLFFITKDADEITAWMVARTPERSRDMSRALGRRAWVALSGYVRGTAAIAAIDAAAIGIGLAIIGVPLVLPLTVLVFLGAFLPVVGAFLAGLVAVLVAVAGGGLGDAVATLLVIVGVQQVEGNVLQPLIMRRAVALHPIVVLAALAVGATLAGIVGAFLSLPVAAVLAAVGNELRLRNENEHDAEDGEPTGAGRARETTHGRHASTAD